MLNKSYIFIIFFLTYQYEFILQIKQEMIVLMHPIGIRHTFVISM